MINMGWTIDKDAKETIKVQGKGSGLWFTRKKDTINVKDPEEELSSMSSSSSRSRSRSPSRKNTISNSKPAPPSRSGSIWITKNPIVEEPEEEPQPLKESPRQRLTRSATVSGFWPGRMNTKDEKELPQRPTHQKAHSESAVAVVKRNNSRNGSQSQSHSDGSGEVTTTQAPAWLINACTALEYITSEHPKAMSIISAILITAGSIPAIPAIAAGAGGAVLASGTAHAIGAVAIGVGQALGAGVAKQMKKEEGGSSHGSISNSGH
ncbi:hypothetical protein GALMADRAFT_594529 [Galerina marginata CBS 339.88]|uniref:Uncharacterized protein n=1 Tax=Galerina marginata (strain CBS 339.88) TaxID=685588 RepID=A0A067SV87_GALM3|nr:hypothetical protein GALMADRAFT_594529 [Galerina marginata CBS 339.88]